MLHIGSILPVLMVLKATSRYAPWYFIVYLHCGYETSRFSRSNNGINRFI